MDRVTIYDSIAGVYKIKKDRHSNIVQETGKYESTLETLESIHKAYIENTLNADEAFTLILEELDGYED